jgi:apolipoprotein N-acyltransferase
MSFTVCYETIFPDKVVNDDGVAEAIINVTNDGWYGLTSGPHQNLATTQMRAVEQGVPLVRAANNGISAFIDPYGRIIKKLDLDEIGVLDSPLPKRLDMRTPYSLYGDKIFFGYALLFLSVMYFIGRRKKVS